MNFDDLNNLHEEKPVRDTGSAWLISLTDLVSLILAFFVMMYASRDISQEKYNEIKDSFTKYMSAEVPEKIYKLIEKPENKVISTKKSADISYLENIMVSNLSSYKDISIRSNESKNKLWITIEKDFSTTNDLEGKINDEITAISQSINPVSNQIQVITEARSIDESFAISELVGRKLEEFGYERNLQITLPDKIITENIENTENKVRIILLINSYENIF